MNYPIVSFTTGEISPQVDARSDIEKYRSGCRILENMIPRMYGPATRRPGTKYIETCNGVARVIPFIYSTEIAYIVLLEDQAMYFYFDGGRVLDSDGRRLKVDTPYLAADLFEIHHKQSNDVMWVLHPNHAPMKLSRTSASSFELKEIVFDNGPFQRRNDLAFGNKILLTPSSTGSSSAEDLSDEDGVVYASSTNLNTSTEAQYAFDDNTESYWQSSIGQTTDQYVSVQWLTAQTIKRVRIAPFVKDAPIFDERANPRFVTIEASNDGSSWTKVKANGFGGRCQEWNDGGIELGKIKSVTEFADISLDNTTAYTYWRVFIHETWGGSFLTFVMRLTEIEFIGSLANFDTNPTLTASANVFDVGHVGALFSLTHKRENTEVGGKLRYPNTGIIDSEILVEGSFTFTTHGTWSGVVALERTVDRIIWETYRSWTGNADTNVQYTGDEPEDNVYYRINVTEIRKNGAPGTVDINSVIRAELTVNSSTQTGIARVTAYNSETSVDIDILKAFSTTDPTTRWAEGSWSTYRGFPRTMTFFESRAVYAGTDHQPQTMWLSGTDDFEDFSACTKDDSSFALTLSSDTRNAIQWVVGTEALILGTTGGEWRVRSTKFDEPLTPTNKSAKQQTNYGSTGIQALVVNDTILFVNYVARKVHEAMYDGNKDKYTAKDVTALAEHITESGIVSIAFQRNPDPLLWCVRNDGFLLSMTYEREQNVIGWARHPFNVGFGASQETTSTVSHNVYPTLQELTDAEIPDTPSSPADTALVSPISVTNKAGLQAMTPGNHYSIDADIDVSGGWTPLDFDSASDIVIEGNNSTISNLLINAPALDDQGLIATWEGGGASQIRNLTFSNCSVGGDRNVGILVGHVANDVSDRVFKNIRFNNCTITHVERWGGMLIGQLECQQTWVDSCHVTNGTIETTDTRVDFIGLLIGSCTEYTSADTISYVLSCSTTGSITISCEYLTSVGGMLGEMDGVDRNQNLYIYDSWSNTDVTYNATAGGTSGERVQGVGGFSGYEEQCRIVSCYAMGSITINTRSDWSSANTIKAIGGFLGDTSCDEQFINCYSTVSISIPSFGGSATVQAIGGFVGFVDINLTALRCYSTGNIDIALDSPSTGSIAGFIGEFKMDDNLPQQLTRCFSHGDISLTGTVIASLTRGGIGGFIGYLNDSGNDTGMGVQDCYCWGSIDVVSTTSNLSIGGFVGEWDTDLEEITFTNCYCAQTDTAVGSGFTGQISDSPYSMGFGGVGGIVNVGATALFYDTETGLSTSPLGDGHITSWMQTQANYEAADWDFSTIWTMPASVTITDYSGEGLGPNSVAVIPSTSEDEVWLVVSRVMDGEIVRYLEQMQPRIIEDQEDQWFVDAGLDYDGEPTTTFSGLDHLEGEEIVVLADGAVMPRLTVTDGAFTLDNAASRVIAGLPFRYKLKPMRFDLQIDGTTKGSFKKFAEVVLSFYESGNVYYGVDVDHLFTIDFRSDEPYDSPPVLFTGDKVVTQDGGYDPEDSIIITGDDPVPCVLRAMVPRIETLGR